ncbi:MAG: peptidyl-prolyl cis-trans isomerase [Acidimicrobiia bacterium]|nr:peptidyl-prolyl cis-trans isomerase [Acidimicrobiia bacterium]
MPRLVRAALREPLVHFLVAGAFILAASAWLNPSEDRHNRIHVTADRIQQLHETWSTQWGEPPDEAQLRTLVEDFIREEVLYREALASGLDQNDSIIRRRLAQKIEFLAQGVTMTEPTDEELRAFFDQHRARYEIPAGVSFEHVFFGDANGKGSGRGASVGEILAGLRSGGVPAAKVRGLGDPFMLQLEYPLQTQTEVRNLFGVEFAERLFTLPVGEWAGPVRSAYGQHLVRVRESEDRRLPDLHEVRDQVATELKRQRAQALVDTYYERLRERYVVEIDEDLLTERP